MIKKISKKYNILIICFLVFGLGLKLHAQKGIVGEAGFYLTKYPGDTTEVVKILNKGDTIEIVWELSTYVKVSSRGEIGFVSKEILKATNFKKLFNSSDNSSMLVPKTILVQKSDSSINTSKARLDTVLKSEARSNIVLKVLPDSSTKHKNVPIESKSSEDNKSWIKKLLEDIDKPPVGFQSGFIKWFCYSFLIVFIFSTIVTTTKGAKDGRYSSGFKPSVPHTLLAIFLTGIISTLIGIGGGLYYWISLHFR